MTPLDLDIRLKTAAAITRDAGKLALDFFHRRDQLEVEHKGMQDLVSLADRQTEDVIRAGLAVLSPTMRSSARKEEVKPPAPPARFGSSIRSTAP